jgi:hypothetical protein
MLIDVAISGDRNVINKEAEKILKYKDLVIEIRHMWIVKATMIPVIIGATGTISKSLRQYLSNIPGKHEIKELQKTMSSFWPAAKCKGEHIMLVIYCLVLVTCNVHMPISKTMTSCRQGGKGR